MKVVLETGDEDIAKVYAATYRNRDDLILEFVDSLTGASSVKEKWVVVISSQFGCPVGCIMCDTYGYFRGNPTAEELFSQVDYLVGRRFPDRVIPSRKFKVQFARMGEPALNGNVIDAIRMIDDSYDSACFMPCISTIAPRGADEFFDDLVDLNRERFRGNFQLQFSVHSTDEGTRDRIMPVERWDLQEISDYGRRFFSKGRKITLNFALGPDNGIDPDLLADIFSRDRFMFKFTPLNPTSRAIYNRVVREYLIEEEVPEIGELREKGFDVVLSIGDPRENEIGSNCGQLAAIWRKDSVA